MTLQSSGEHLWEQQISSSPLFEHAANMKQTRVGSKNRFVFLTDDFIIGIVVTATRLLYDNINIPVAEKWSIFVSDPVTCAVYPVLRCIGVGRSLSEKE
jgi:hypothetical protein